MKRLLLCVPLFYEYPTIIASGLRDKGYEVDVLLYPHSLLYKLLEQYAYGGNMFSKYESFYFRKQKKWVGSNYDVVLAIKASMMPESFIQFLKEKNKRARFIQYIWDDISIDNKVITTFKYFDKICSFNPYDCKEYGLSFRPFFFAPQGISLDAEKSLDILFIVSYRKDRFNLAKKITEFSKKNQLKVKIILRASIVLFLSDLIHHLPYVSLFKTKGVPYVKMMNLLSRSVCSIELPAFSQIGLTTRPFEAMGTRTKIITTNKDIENYDFYNPNNIKIIDEVLFDINCDWLKRPYEDVPELIKNKYTIQTFLNDILSE